MKARFSARQCWELAMPSTQKLVAICLSYHADEDGLCWPSVSTICRETGLSERAVQGALAWLETHKAMRRDLRKGRSTHYHLTPAVYVPPQQVHPHPRRTCTPTPAFAAPPGVQVVHPTPAAGAPRTYQGTTHLELSAIAGSKLPSSTGKDFLFKEGLQALQAQGVAEGNARSLLGRLAKHRGDAVAAADIRDAIARQVVDLPSWLGRILSGPARRQAADGDLRSRFDYTEGLPERAVA